MFAPAPENRPIMDALIFLYYFVYMAELLDYLAPSEKLQCARTRCLTHSTALGIIF
jgi:hypothetical protein